MKYQIEKEGPKTLSEVNVIIERREVFDSV